MTPRKLHSTLIQIARWLVPLALVVAAGMPRPCRAYAGLIGRVSAEARDGVLMVRAQPVDVRAASVYADGKLVPLAHLRVGMRVYVEGECSPDGRTLTAERIEVDAGD